MSKIVESYSGKTKNGRPYNVTVVERDSEIPEAKFVIKRNKKRAKKVGRVLSVASLFKSL